MTQLKIDTENTDDPTTTASEDTADLVARLPDLRAIPGCPTGSDEAIAAMSRPRGHTACPNPYSADLVQDRRDGYAREPFATDIAAGKGSLIYKAHSYPTKVPHQAIMRFLLHYTEPGDLVLDGFAGSGMTGVAAQACGAPEAEIKEQIEAEFGAPKWGARRAFLQDLAPNATFLAAGLNLPVDAAAFDEASTRLLERFDRDWGWMYETTTPNGKPARVDFTVWSQVFTCPHCAGEVVFYDAAFDEATEKVRDAFGCPACGAAVSKGALLRRKTSVRTLGGDTIERIELRPVKLQWRTDGKTGWKRCDAGDLAVLRRIATISPPWFPTDPLPLDQMTHGSRLGPKGFTKVHHLWCDRALAALAALWGMCDDSPDPNVRRALRFWVEQALWGFSFMNRYRPDGFSQVSQFQSGVYYVPSLHAEPSPRYNLVGSQPARGKRQSLVKMWEQSPARDGAVRISTGSSTRVPLPDDSADYCFVDPPFGANIPYSDLALVVEHWHRVLTNVSEEAILDTFRHKGLPEYTGLMTACFREFYRVLKPGRWMTVEFSNSSNSVWLGIQQALASVGFVVADTSIFDKEVLSYRQVTATNAVKRDLIISAYKPATEVGSRTKLAAGSAEGVWAFVRDHLAHLKVKEGTKGKAILIRERQADRLFDRMVAYHVANGLTFPMSASEFNDGLEQRFILRDEMFFLPEQAEEYERFRLTFRDLSQQTFFITNEASAVQWVRQQLKSRPSAYSDIQPEFFTELQSGGSEWEALPDLHAILDENFVQDSAGRWMVPDPRKSEHLEQIRQRALLREFARYGESRGRLDKVRSEAIRAGFQDAWTRKDYATIVKIGKRLPEEVFADETTLLHYYRNSERLAGV
jgi:16S rRNA G966 N2-methylase RsmD